MRLSRLYEKYVDWYYRRFPIEMEEPYFKWSFLHKETARHVFVRINGVKLLVLVALDVAGNPFVMCHHRRMPGNLKLQGFYHGGRLYPARFFNLYLKVGLGRHCDLQSKPGRSH